MIRLSLPLSKSEQSHMTLVDCLSQVWHDDLIQKGFGDQATKELEIATDLIKRQQSLKAQPDQALQQLLAKVEQARARAVVLGNRKPTANVPTGTNVP